MRQSEAPSMIKRARDFALVAHEGQMYSAEPYSMHLEHVVNVLHRYGVDSPDTIAAAWLHDVVEDCDIPRTIITTVFGSYVSHLVWCVTNEPGANRRERNSKTYPKIRSNRDAVLVKLADRIANAECSHKGGGKLAMYRKEYPGFRAALYDASHLEAAPMWERLDSLLGLEGTPDA